MYKLKEQNRKIEIHKIYSIFEDVVFTRWNRLQTLYCIALNNILW